MSWVARLDPRIGLLVLVVASALMDLSENKYDHNINVADNDGNKTIHKGSQQW